MAGTATATVPAAVNPTADAMVGAVGLVWRSTRYAAADRPASAVNISAGPASAIVSTVNSTATLLAGRHQTDQATATTAAAATNTADPSARYAAAPTINTPNTNGSTLLAAVVTGASDPAPASSPDPGWCRRANR